MSESMSPVLHLVADAVTRQTFQVLKAMEANDFSITAREAMLDLDMTSSTLARRICDAEEAGVNITRERKRNPVTGKRYTRYFFDPLVIDLRHAATTAA